MTGMQLALHWAGSIRDNAALAELVAQMGKKPLTIGVGYDAVQEFGKAQCPYVYISPSEDTRGPQAEQLEFSIVLFLGLHTDKKTVNTNGILVNVAMDSMDRFFAPAVLACLQHLDTPPLEGQGQLYPAENGYCEKHIMLTYSEDQPIYLENPWA